VIANDDDSGGVDGGVRLFRVVVVSKRVLIHHDDSGDMTKAKYVALVMKT